CHTPGVPQADGCDPCVTQVCAADAFCCATAWDAQCVDEVGTICGSAACVGPPLCAHSACTTGAALSSLCHSCVNLICSLDSYCCPIASAVQCVGAVGSVSGLTCWATGRRRSAQQRIEDGADLARRAVDRLVVEAVAQARAQDVDEL